MTGGVVCSVCGHANSAGARFCSNCGARLGIECPRCGHHNDASGSFCTECGGPLSSSPGAPQYTSPQSYTPQALADKILAGRKQLEGERKLVTAVFADVVGFTTMSERLDPEDAHALMRRCFDVMLDAVHRYEGTVTQFLGDGMLALFGAPIAHEDHAYRATRAGLGIQEGLVPLRESIQEEWGLDFRVRVGLNSGPVVVGNVGTDLSMEYLAIGDTVNLASRIQSIARPGSVVLSENTYRLAHGYFVTKDLGEHDIKGKELPVRVYEVVRPIRWRSRVDVYAESGLPSMVGRDSELEVLLDRAHRIKSGSGQVVFLRGEAGIGKSRLLFELRRRLQVEDSVWVVGRCVSYGEDIAYLPIIDLVQDAFSIEEGDSRADIARKLDEIASTISSGSVAPYLRHLVGIDPGDPSVTEMDPQLRKARTFDALCSTLLGLARDRPLIVTIEDLHWIDRVSTEFLSYLIETVAENSILLLLTHRPDWHAPFGVRPYFTDIPLNSLTAEQSAQVAEAIVGEARLPSDLQSLIHRKTEGNPFFVEEVMKSLVEVGAIRASNGKSSYELARPLEDIFVPDTIQDVIMARLDRLPSEPKKALQTAAVIGREFTVKLLERTANLGARSDDSLSALKSVELIYERSLYPELAFMFRHALTHDVAYNSLLLRHRKSLHHAVGSAIEEIYADRLQDHFEALAYHFEHAELWDKAMTYLLRSGEKAISAFAPSQALRFFDRALALVAEVRGTFASQELLELHTGRAQALRLLNEWEKSAASFDEMGEVARKAGDQAAQGLALVGSSTALFLAHRFEDALDHARRAHEFGAKIGDETVVAGSLVTTVGVKLVTGELEGAGESLAEAMAAARAGHDPVLEGMAHVWSGFFDHWQGDESKALTEWSEGSSLAEKQGLPMILMWAWWTRGLALIGQGRYAEALTVLNEHLELSRRLGESFFRCRTLNTLGWLYMDLCNWDVAIEYNLKGSQESRLLGDPEIIRNAELNLADCYLALGDIDEAERWLRGVERDSATKGAWGEEWMKWRYTQHLHVGLGELLLVRGDVDGATMFANRCLQGAESTGAKRNIVKGRRLRGKILMNKGCIDEAEREFESALTVARQVGNPAQVRETLAAAASLRRKQGRLEEAAAIYDEALALVQGMAESLSDTSAAETLLKSPQVQALRAGRSEATD
jgi:class 3 adenylate cyclase/tetratricopeptide (TPR) repeat protein